MNYPWLPHNMDPSIPTPPENENMPVQPLGNRQKFYNDMIQGCIDYFANDANLCRAHKRDRADVSLRQPQSMYNYTSTAFAKIKAPEHSSPTYLLDVGDNSLIGGGSTLRQAIWDSAKSTIQGWTGQDVRECSLYGVQIYTNGSVLNTHVDRLPLVSSAIIYVDQDLDEPWSLEVIGHDGKAHNVIGKVGEQDSSNSDLPPYIIPGSLEESNWRRENPEGFNPNGKGKDVNGAGSTMAHEAAQNGAYQELVRLVTNHENLIHAQDENGWTPMHEGNRAGYFHFVKYLYEKGANVTHRSNGGCGGSPLHLARQMNGNDHPVVKFLVEVGGQDVESEL